MVKTSCQIADSSCQASRSGHVSVGLHDVGFPAAGRLTPKRAAGYLSADKGFGQFLQLLLLLPAQNGMLAC